VQREENRILLADDHTMICDGFRKLPQPEYEVVGAIGDGRALLEAAEELKPDLVLADIGMPLLNGLDAVRQLKKLMPRLKAIFLTMNPDSDVASKALRIGASGYLLKNSHIDELLKAVRDVVIFDPEAQGDPPNACGRALTQGNRTYSRHYRENRPASINTKS